MCRLPTEVSDDVDEDPGGAGSFEHAKLNGAQFKVDEIVQYHVGETVCGLQRATLTPGGADAIVYWTLYGAIGALQPFLSREDVDFFTHLEMHLRGAAGAREQKSKDSGVGACTHAHTRTHNALAHTHTHIHCQKQDTALRGWGRVLWVVSGSVMVLCFCDFVFCFVYV